MSNYAEFQNQLSELTVRLSAMVAEKLAMWTRDFEPHERHRILDMIEGNLPNVIANTIMKTPSLQNADGVAYFERNIDQWADEWAKKFITK